MHVSGFLSARRLLTHGVAISAVVMAASVGTAPLTASAYSGQTRLVSAGGTGGFVVGGMPDSTTGVQQPETVASADAGSASDRSHSAGTGTSVGSISQPNNVTNSSPNLVTSFNGLDHFQNRFVADGGKQFSLEPPDQGLCVGSDGTYTRVMEILNDVTAVYDASGSIVSNGGVPTSLNQFMHEGHSIIRSPLTYGEFETDPSCLYDAATQRWFAIDFAIDQVPSGANAGKFTGANHLNLAVSNTQDPAGAWTIYNIPTEDDGTNGTPNHGCSSGGGTPPAYVTNPTACFADYPHLGADANGIYLTTNEYSFFGPEFHGAQVYALDKSALAALAASVTATQFDTHDKDTFGFARNGFTLWPSTTPGGGGDSASNCTEYFLSSNAAAEAHDDGTGTPPAQPSTQLLTWAIDNTADVTSNPSAMKLTVAMNAVGLYAAPPQAEQKSGNTPLRDCANNNACSLTLFGFKDPYAEKPSTLDSNDTRMQQVTFAAGHLWGALDTAVGTSNGKQAGIEWFKTTPDNSSGSVASALAAAGYLALGNDSLTYPAIGINSGGTGVMAFTVVGPDFYPSAGYALLGAGGPGDVHIAAPGLGPDDGFTTLKVEGATPGVARPRWGDYGAAVVWGGSVWIASEYIGQTCDFSTFKKTNFRCGNTRTALANWYTRISEVTAP